MMNKITSIFATLIVAGMLVFAPVKEANAFFWMFCPFCWGNNWGWYHPYSYYPYYNYGYPYYGYPYYSYPHYGYNYPYYNYYRPYRYEDDIGYKHFKDDLDFYHNPERYYPFIPAPPKPLTQKELFDEEKIKE